MPQTTRPTRWRLDEKFIRRLKPPERGNRLYYDDSVSGFAVRITAAGVVAFCLNYYGPSGRERRLTIGRWGVWSATAARARAKELRRQIDLGSDPLDERQERRRGETFGDLAAEYVTRYASLKKSGHQDRRFLESDVLPDWRNLPVREIERRDVIRLIERKAETAPVAANRVLAVIRKLFNWAIERDLVDKNPCLQVRAPGKETSRDRVLSLAEVSAFWAGFTPSNMSADVVAAMRLILATAQRPGEVCGLQWADLDLAAGWWTIPAARAKNELAHRVWLNDVARDVLESRRRRGKWVFPSPRTDGPIEPHALAHAIRRNRALERGDPQRVEIGAFTPHDLRRTAASQMAASGTPRLVVGQVLNHVESGVTAVYDRHSYDQEKRRALDGWGRILAQAIGAGEPAKVVEIR